MQLQRKQDNHTPQQQTGTEKLQKWKRPVPVDWKHFVVDLGALIPYGKYIHKTVSITEWIL